MEKLVTEAYRQQSAICKTILDQVIEEYGSLENFRISGDTVADKDHAINQVCQKGLAKIFHLSQDRIQNGSDHKASKIRDYIYFILKRKQNMTFRDIQKLYPTTAYTHVWKKVGAMDVWVQNYEEEKLVIGGLNMAIDEIFNLQF